MVAIWQSRRKQTHTIYYNRKWYT